MNQLYRKALLKADEIRMQLGLDIFEPVNIFDSCISLGVTVRFVDINMEGMYLVQEDETHPTIVLSSLRPLPRRCYTCGHELGHHVFKHGSKIDGLSHTEEPSTSNESEEFLVDSFAGALLMPIAGIQAEFAKRNWTAQNASPLEFYMISSIFGTGYQTLIVHCRTNKIINEAKASILLKSKPAKIFKDLFTCSADNSYFKIFDGKSEISVIDLEVSNYIIFPSNFIVEGDHLQKVQQTSIGTGYIAARPGIVRVTSNEGAVSSFVRIQNFRYVGLVENRHLENEID
ncbi:ImmA/IrrE family metallo-endopeptidase [Chitinophagaceae bacterium LB-8]|uniref:ImmA/IrrE family metallo-endopeptidase n=1 Tax=Paraflavisolibacter caeni TaxID=2982496 RepID=A0A9X2XWA6_9BACT|nr:ImmA/IrrE family metallo-endopeptidase [Paraflavisolibacter caeni]MCU7549822.1 ImmA/IrrE family metallo-endopeptidase [Paraflavisolibacter caeni]